jgi:hypothetical protein
MSKDQKKKQQTQRPRPDDPRQANESGEPQVSGRSHGRIVDRQDPNGPARTAPDASSKKGAKDDTSSEHWESGRQRSS